MKKKMYVYKKHWWKLIDFLQAKNIAKKNYEQVVNNLEKDHQIKYNYHINSLSKQLHPQEQIVKIKKIIDETKDTKSFILSSLNKQPLAFFRAGQYINLKKINDEVSRVFSLSSNPNDCFKNEYMITVRKKENGYLSNYFFNEAKVNDKLILSSPDGTFYYDALRDAKHVLAIAGGSGITPFYSMLQAIDNNIEDFNITLLYAIKTEDDIIFKQQLEALSKNNKIKIVYLFSQQKQLNNFETTNDTYFKHLDIKIINKYYHNNDSLWICGSKRLINNVLEMIKPLKIKQKFIRYEKHTQLYNPEQFLDYINLNKQKTYKVIVHQLNTIKTIKINADESILVGLFRNKINIKNRCLNGTCSCCRFHLLKGQVYISKKDDCRRKADHYNNIYFACSSFAISDLEIILY